MSAPDPPARGRAPRTQTASQLKSLLAADPDLSIAQAAERLGISRSWAHEVLTDHDGSDSRQRKLRNRPACGSCGRSTGARDGRCSSCTAEHRHKDQKAHAAARLIAWKQEHGWVPTSTDLNATHARKTGGDALRRQQMADVNAEAVRRAFGGTYRDAIEAIFGPGVRPGDGRQPPQRTFR